MLIGLLDLVLGVGELGGQLLDLLKEQFDVGREVVLSVFEFLFEVVPRFGDLLGVHFDLGLHPVHLVGQGLDLLQLVIRILQVVHHLLLEKVQPPAQVVELVLDVLVLLFPDVVDFLLDFHQLLLIFRRSRDLVDKILDGRPYRLILIDDVVEHGQNQLVLNVNADLKELPFDFDPVNLDQVHPNVKGQIAFDLVIQILILQQFLQKLIAFPSPRLYELLHPFILLQQKPILLVGLESLGNNLQVFIQNPLDFLRHLHHHLVVLLHLGDEGLFVPCQIVVRAWELVGSFHKILDYSEQVLFDVFQGIRKDNAPIIIP